ncbi:hypothetical protein GCM10023346_22930 [Arthrobacter gyeryongensis]|uniref:Uncharacterized protein n=1 Tax=Arthrobacter gyeryongensis TaxID=1650592 RepID=A0ABP9SGA8_9MICC
MDALPSSVFWAESYWKNGRWTACAANNETPSQHPAGARMVFGGEPQGTLSKSPPAPEKGATKPRRPPNSKGVHPKRTRTLCTKAQYKS